MSGTGPGPSAGGRGRGTLPTVVATRFLGHRTIFPADFLADFGFHGRRTAGRIELMRLDLRAIELEPERIRLGRLRERLTPVINPTPAAVR